MIRSLVIATIFIATCALSTGAEAKKSSKTATHAAPTPTVPMPWSLPTTWPRAATWTRPGCARASARRACCLRCNASCCRRQGHGQELAAYRARFIEPVRVSAPECGSGRNMPRALARAEQEYGVPQEIIVGIVGVETIYGQHMGNFRVMDALTTLAFDFPSVHPRAAERQAEFFQPRAGAVPQPDATAPAIDPHQPTRQLRWRHGAGPSSCRRAGRATPWTLMATAALNLFSQPARTPLAPWPTTSRAMAGPPGMPTHYSVRLRGYATVTAGRIAGARHPAHLQPHQHAGQGRFAGCGRRTQHAGPLALVELENGDDTRPPTWRAPKTSTPSRATTGPATTPWR
jgi:membrane-bound lytic murein transglycosylase B